MTKINVKIEVRDRTRDTSDREYNAKARVYFGHEGENIVQNLMNRRDRPSALYGTYLGDVAEAMGLPRATKFKWSQKAGCSCGCSPGFICADASRKDVFVTLSAEAPRNEGNPRQLINQDSINQIEQMDNDKYREQIEALIS